MTASLTKNEPALEVTATTASVKRSSEFLACAKTALKIGKNQHKHDPQPPPPNAWWQVSPDDLRLMDTSTPRNTRSKEILEDGLALLRTMGAELKQ